MKNQYRKKLTKALLTVLLVCGPTLFALAQCPDPNNPDCGGGPGGPGVPLEGADILLLAMGALFVAIKFWQYNHMKKAQSV